MSNVERPNESIREDEKSPTIIMSTPEKEMLETDERIIVHLYLPSVEKNDLSVDLTADQLVVYADSEKTGVIQRKIRFLEEVVISKAEAKFENGVLTVEAPKKSTKPFTPSIKEPSGSKNENLNKQAEDTNSQDDRLSYYISILASSNSSMRDKAVNNLVDIGEPALESVIRATKNDDSVIRQKACDVLGLMGDLRAVNPLCNLLKDSNKYVRRRAANAIILIHDERFVIPLINALDDSDFKVRVLAANALGIIGDQRAVEPLTKIKNMPISEFKHLLFGNFNERMLIAAAKFSLEKLEIRREEDLKKQMEKHENSLNTFKNLYENHENEEANKFIKEHLIKDLESSYEEIQDNTAIFLSNIGYGAVEPLIEALKSPNEDVRGYAAAILGNIGDPRAVEPLIEALKSPNDCVKRPHADNPEWNFRALAALALGDIGDVRALEPLQNVLNDPYKDVRLNAVIALGKIDHPRVLDLLFKALDDPAKSVRTAAAEALGYSGNPDAVWHLITACNDPSPQVRLSAVKALGELGDPRGFEELSDSSRRDNQTIQLAAIESIYNIGGEEAHWRLEHIVNSYADLEIKKAAANALLKFEK